MLAAFMAATLANIAWRCARLPPDIHGLLQQSTQSFPSP
jgi:hypothetical protein